ncbi:MAG: ArnT family glycosyltransferase, partial [Gemmataceae bacterium]
MTDISPRPAFVWADAIAPIVTTVLFIVANLITTPVVEPWKNGDETRHVMTGVFFHDALADGRTALADPQSYAIHYYGQYPALGILMWPPLFYALEGLAMTLFGPHFAVARGLIYLFVGIAAFYQYRLARLLHSAEDATLAVALLLVSPLMFTFSSYVMLEVPTMALVLAACYHLEVYFQSEKTRSVAFAGVAAALAALTRFDAVLFLIYVLIRLIQTGRWKLLRRRAVWGAVALAAVLSGPYYLFTINLYSTGLATAAVEGTGADRTSFLNPWNLIIYFGLIPYQIGFLPAALAFVALFRAIPHRAARQSWPVALFLATLITFVPFAEPDYRHTIYWVPALALIVVRQLRQLPLPQRLRPVLLCLGIAWYGWTGESVSGDVVAGNQEAVQFCLNHSTTDRPIFIDSSLNGAFIYYVRIHDTSRTKWVIRGDKLIYAVLSDPHAGTQNYTQSDADIIAKL